MPRTASRFVPILLAVVLNAACGGSSEPSSTVRRGSGTDPVGDAFSAGGDLVRASARVENDTVLLSASFVLADFTGQDLMVEFFIDTDESGTTGDLSFDPGLGSDYVIVFYKDYPEIGIARWQNGGWISVGTLTSGSGAQDSSVTAKVPMALLGGDEGRLRFKTRSSWWNSLTYDISDLLTAGGSPAVVVH